MKNKGGRPTKLTEEWLKVAEEVIAEKFHGGEYKEQVLDLFSRVRKDIKDDEKYFLFLVWFKDGRSFKDYRGEERGIKFKNHKQYGNEYYHKVIKKNPHKRLRNSFASLLRHHIKKGGKSTFDITKKYLGYDIDDLKTHLEKQFKEGMKWENYGKWHVDHVIPDCRFSYSSFEDEGFKKAWALENLQPLWAEENFKKNQYATNYN